MTAPQRHVLAVINGVVDTFGGSLRAAVNLADAHAAGGSHVTFSAPITRSAPHVTVDLMDPRVERRLFVASRPVARFGGSIRQAWWLWRNVRRFDEVDLHGIFALSALSVIAACTLRRVPVLLWPHGSLDPTDVAGNHPGVKRVIGPVIVRPLLNRCAALIFTTDEESRLAQTYGARTPHEVVALPVAPLPVDGIDAAGWRERHGIPADVPLVLFLGRIVRRKRLPLLIEALAVLEHRDTHLVVVGEGGGGPDSDEEAAFATSKRLGLTSRVHPTGWLEGSDRIGAFLAADVFVLLSESENFGLSVVEAMSVGCPPVISDKLVLAEDLERAGAAVCVRTRNPAEVAAAIDGLLARPDEAAKVGERARDFVAREYAPPVVAARLRELAQGSAGFRSRAIGSLGRKGEE